MSISGKIKNELSDSEELLKDELYEHYRFTADKGQQPLRIDKFLTSDSFKGRKYFSKQQT
jgi:hypothetical protein